MISEVEENREIKRNSIQVGLRSPTEVLSTNYILKTEQNQSLLTVSRFYFSPYVLILNFCGLGGSSFIIFW